MKVPSQIITGPIQSRRHLKGSAPTRWAVRLPDPKEKETAK